MSDLTDRILNHLIEEKIAFMDESILENQEIVFNVGSLEKSLVMSVEDYIKIVTPIVCKFAK